jgi:hypothetical protein
MTDTNAPRFSAERRDDLQKQGLVDPQIQMLETVLPLIAVLVTNQPRLQDVRAELHEVAHTVKRLQDLLSGLEQAGKANEVKSWIENVQREDKSISLLMQRISNGARAEALLAIQTSEILAGVADDVVGRADKVLADVALVVHRAIGGLPRDSATGKLRQRRPNSATVGPIWLIHNALLAGWEKAYLPSSSGHSPPFTMKISASANSEFREIVGICYETATAHRDVDPERAIRRYVRRKKDRELSQTPQ